MEARSSADRYRHRSRHRTRANLTGAVIDTNVLVFDTFEDSEFHGRAARTLDAMGKWHLPSIVFHELIWFFRTRKIRLTRARLKVEEYLTNEKTSFLPCSVDDIRFAVLRMTKHQEYNDLVILSAAKRLGLPLFTFDDELKQIAIRNYIRLVT